MVPVMDPARQKACHRTANPRGGCPRTTFCPVLLSAAFNFALFASSAARTQSVQTDKLLHAGASAAVVDVVWAGCAVADQPLWVKVVASVSAGVVVGVGKEALDAAGFGDPDVNDLLFDGFGIGLGVAVALVVETAASASADQRGSGQTIDGPE